MVLLLDAHRRAYNGSQQACKKIVKLLGVANVKSSFQQEYMSDGRLTLMLHQQVQKCLAVGGGGPVDGSEANAHFYLEQGWGNTRSSGGSYRPKQIGWVVDRPVRSNE